MRGFRTFEGSWICKIPIVVNIWCKNLTNDWVMLTNGKGSMKMIDLANIYLNIIAMNTRICTLIIFVHLFYYILFYLYLSFPITSIIYHLYRVTPISLSQVVQNIYEYTPIIFLLQYKFVDFYISFIVTTDFV